MNEKIIKQLSEKMRSSEASGGKQTLQLKNKSKADNDTIRSLSTWLRTQRQ